MNGSPIGSPKIMREWSRWICNHIETSDKVCGSFVRRVIFYFISCSFSNILLPFTSKKKKKTDFPSRIFIEHLFEITQSRFQRLYSSKVSTNTQLVVPTSSITSSVDSFKATMQHQHMKLLQILNFSVRRSPKRRLDSITSSEQGR